MQPLGDSPTFPEGQIDAFSDKYRLTARQRELLVSLLRGESQKEVAYHLRIAHTTIRFHAVQLYRRCGVSNQREFLVLFARSLGPAIMPAAPSK